MEELTVTRNRCYKNVNSRFHDHFFVQTRKWVGFLLHFVVNTARASMNTNTYFMTSEKQKQQAHIRASLNSSGSCFFLPTGENIPANLTAVWLTLMMGNAGGDTILYIRLIIIWSIKSQKTGKNTCCNFPQIKLTPSNVVVLSATTVQNPNTVSWL